jgi:hypothetical protein
MLINIDMQRDLQAGVIANFFNEDQLESIRSILNKLDKTQPKAGGWCCGLDKHNKVYPWFRKIVLQPLREEFHPKLDLIFGMLLHSINPFGVHSDHFQLNVPGKQFKSFLIPINVDGSSEHINDAKTIIFDQIDEHAKMSVNPTKEQLPVIIPPEDSALMIYDEDLTHIPRKSAEVLSVKLAATWQKGDLIYWNSLLLHTSNDFLARNHSYKECIVMHTFIPVDC